MIKSVVFDFGGVLLDWNPRHLFRKLFADESEMEHFLTDVCSVEWHIKQDAGHSCGAAIKQRQDLYPHYADLIDVFYRRFDEMIAGPISGTVDVLLALHDRGVPLYAITNWPGDTFHISARYPFMSVFRGIVVSGYEGIMKPDARIFRTLFHRYNLAPETSLFIDDVEKNVRAAEQLGMAGHLFTSPTALRADLIARRMLA